MNLETIYKVKTEMEETYNLIYDIQECISSGSNDITYFQQKLKLKARELYYSILGITGNSNLIDKGRELAIGAFESKLKEITELNYDEMFAKRN